MKIFTSIHEAILRTIIKRKLKRLPLKKLEIAVREIEKIAAKQELQSSISSSPTNSTS